MFEVIYLLKSIVMGIVEGVTEFLPISSTGHLIISQSLLGLPADRFNAMFMVVIQLGAILAVLLLFWPRIWTKLGAFFRGQAEGRQFMRVWILGCLPAVVLGLGWEILDLDAWLFRIPVVAAAMIVGAVLLLVLERRAPGSAAASGQPGAAVTTTDKVEDISNRQALTVGLMQCLSLWPGFSRSAATIMGGWLAGFTTPLAADYSFFLAIPIMFGASGLKLVRFDFAGIAGYQIASLIVGFVVSFVVALLVVKAFLAFLHRHRLAVFAWYRIAVGALLILLLAVGVL
ncbi:MAG: undecaprenyl-diphosphate phosphatase [Bacillota bacterium]|nr:undecaprenyl-diphosphate phosphatase [Bacillota bacterium]